MSKKINCNKAVQIFLSQLDKRRLFACSFFVLSMIILSAWPLCVAAQEENNLDAAKLEESSSPAALVPDIQNFDGESSSAVDSSSQDAEQISPENAKEIEEGLQKLQPDIEKNLDTKEQLKKSAWEEYKQNIQSKDFTQIAKLRALNKITTHVSALDVSVDKPMRFGTLEIRVHRCWRAPPEENPESKALLEVWEQVPGEERKRLFFGWMFSSSPALSALEHAVYDLSVIDCRS